MPDMSDLEARDIECEIRQRHQPILHGTSPCPSGTCCSCGAVGGCDAGTVLVMLDTEREQVALAAQQPTSHPGGEP